MPELPRTTAEVIGSYFKELVAQGLPAELVSDLVRHAASQIHANDGIVVGPTGRAATA